MQHETLLENIDSHGRQAEDLRFRDLCDRYLPRLRSHQRLLGDYARTIGAEPSGLKRALGDVLGKARNIADMGRESDFLRLVGDIVLIRQAQDTFGCFAAIGDKIAEPKLSEIGRQCEREHDEMQREFNALARTMFVDHALETDARRAADLRDDVRL
jgi:hypothetical protein